MDNLDDVANSVMQKLMVMDEKTLKEELKVHGKDGVGTFLSQFGELRLNGVLDIWNESKK